MALKKRRAAKPDFSRVEKKDESATTAVKPKPPENKKPEKPAHKPFWKRIFR